MRGSGLTAERISKTSCGTKNSWLLGLSAWYCRRASCPIRIGFGHIYYLIYVRNHFWKDCDFKLNYTVAGSMSCLNPTYLLLQAPFTEPLPCRYFSIICPEHIPHKGFIILVTLILMGLQSLGYQYFDPPPSVPKFPTQPYSPQVPLFSKSLPP